MKRFTAIAAINSDVNEGTLVGIKQARLQFPVTHKSFQRECFCLDVLHLCEVGLHCVYSLEQHQKSEFGAPIGHLSRVH